ncbi:hypothetical protein [Paenibacillus sp.]|uniref:hypothetical protein n=1 Tax=Paenibacillus sp. TaxID=58172 RepID=UPI0028116F44|nr:hypothetical protein [Paenibacillus sp.]
MTIAVHEDLRLFEIQTARTSYVFGLNERGILHQLHWGERIVGRESALRLRSVHHSSFDAEVEREYEEYSFWAASGTSSPALRFASPMACAICRCGSSVGGSMRMTPRKASAWSSR